MERKTLRKLVVLSIWEDIWSLGGGGGVADELQFIRHCTRKGIELHFLIPEPRERRECLAEPLLTYHTYPNVFRLFERFPRVPRRFLWPAFFPLVALPALRRLVRQVRPDAILGFTHYSLHPMNRVGAELGIPTIVKLFGVMYLDRFDFPKLKYYWKSVDQVVAFKTPVDHYIILNDGTRGLMALMRLGVPAERISFLPNGMDTEWADMPVDRDEARRTMGIPLDKLVLLTYSRLIRSKRIELFFRAAAKLDKSILDRAVLVVGGDGPERARLEREARHAGLADRTIFTGVVAHRDVVHLLKASDVFVGTNELTNMSLPPCEAILCGVPVVAFDVSGTAEVVRDGETGLLARNDDVDDLARKIARIVEDDGLRRRLARQAAEFGRGYFVSWDDRVEMELEVIERLAAGERPPSAADRASGPSGS